MFLSAQQAAGGIIAFAAIMNGDLRPRLPSGELVSQRRGFGSTAKLKRKRAKQFRKMEARNHRKLMKEVR